MLTDDFSANQLLGVHFDQAERQGKKLS